jgi:hypothetical protein
VTVKGLHDQAGTKKCAKIEHDDGKSEKAATGKCRIGYSDALKAGAQKDSRERDSVVADAPPRFLTPQFSAENRASY